MNDMSQDPGPGGFSAVDYNPFADAAPIARVVPATEAQREIWLACQLGAEASLAYNESVSLRLQSPSQSALDAEALRRALGALVARHDALRATFGADGQDMFIAETLALDMPVHDISALTAEQREASLQRHIRADVDTPFNLEQGPLLRAQLIELSECNAVLVLTAHHIVCDGWSFGVLLRELAALLAVAASTHPDAALPVAETYADHALAQLDPVHVQQAEADTSYWVSLYDRSVPVLDLPTRRPRLPQRAFASRREDLRLDSGTLEAVRKLGARHGVSLFAALFGVFAGLISRLSGQDEVVIGVSAAGQSAEGSHSLVGHCVNLLPIRMLVDVEADASALLLQSRTAVLDAYEHQSVSFGGLLKHLQLQREPGRLPLVSVLFNLDARMDAAAFAPAGLQAEVFSNPRSAENFELYLNATQDAQGLLLECQYKTALFDQATVRRWLELYREALVRAAADPAQTLAALLAPPPAEQALLAAWNNTARDGPPGLRLNDLLQAGLQHDPTATALVFEGQTLSYRELHARARQLAHALRAQGAGPGGLVGVCLERSLDLVVALVGIIASGAAYVPLDPCLPVERLAGMVEDAGVKLLVTRHTEHAGRSSAFAAAGHAVFIDAIVWQADDAVPPLPQLGGDADPAYVMFTSGSTGRPKGAMNAHRGIVNRLLWMQQAYALQPGERVLQKTPLSFDVSVWEFFWPLSVGATLVVARPDGHRDSAYLADLAQRERIDVMHFVPSMLRFFLDEPAAPACTRLRRVVCSGEALPLDLVERFFTLLPQAKLANLYGPTEAAVDVSAWECRPAEPSGTVPIGAPIANTQLHVLDTRLRPLPIGTAGDLYIGGAQVGMGYVKRPELTAERFITDPFKPGGRLYKTGDIARWRGDGALDYLGRSDHQVKVRGYRIELGEIENHLLTLPGISHAVAITREDSPGDLRLVAYVVGRDGPVDSERLRERLRQVLPDYMVPQNIVQLDAIPLLSSGKLDRRALPAPNPAQTGSGRSRVPARDVTEQTVLGLMEQVLKLPEMSVLDDFFALGGHSLLAARLIAQLNGALDLNLPLRLVFESPTAERMAQAIEKARVAGGMGRVAIRHDPSRIDAPLTAQQERIAFMEELYPGRVVYNTPSAHRLRGPLALDAFEQALHDMVSRQPVLRSFIRTTNGAHAQVVAPQVEFELPFDDLSQWPDAEREAELMRRMQAMVDRPIDIHQVPLFRAALFRLAPEEHAFLFMPHHIIWDGWSFDLLYSEMAACYTARKHGTANTLPPLPVTYADYAQWQTEWMQSPVFAAQLRDWNARMAEAPAPKAPKTDKPRSAGMSGGGATEWVRIDKTTTESLHDMARQTDVTLNMLALALYGAMMAHAADSSTLVIGVPVRGRMMTEVEPVMGFFNNLLPLQLRIDLNQTASDYLRSVKQEFMDVLSFQDIPFERLAMEPEMMARSQRAGIYQALFSFQDARERTRQWADLEQSSILIFQKGATEDLGLWLMEVPGGLEGGFTYNTDIYTAQTAAAFKARYLELVQRFVTDPGQPLRTLLATEHSAAAAGLRHLSSGDMPQPAPSLAPPDAARPPREPTRPLTPTEQALSEVWAGLLGLKPEQIEPQDNYFDLGGDSLTAMQAVIGMHERTGKRANARLLIFETLGQIALHYDALEVEALTKPGLVKRLFGGLGRSKSMH
ncbi:Amino acid adenylation domain protein [Thiomonas sp. X19]|uniref:non-ribosomal peptide synthetase n=1 Tax=Thiomonas sp. X19 TaxID=1050370 RepID=UPI000B7032A3|nr:non-ribosomal peptide synthetase [Thiomonas sp. X19]SCC91285.1 Amino acid adenylation domain protein [Thiomonas sp. X19]